MGVNPASTVVIAVLPKAPDLEMHVREIDIDSVRLVEFRDFIPSLREYGRGYWFPKTSDSIYGLINALTEILNEGGK